MPQSKTFTALTTSGSFTITTNTIDHAQYPNNRNRNSRIRAQTSRSTPTLTPTPTTAPKAQKLEPTTHKRDALNDEGDKINGVRSGPKVKSWSGQDAKHKSKELKEVKAKISEVTSNEEKGTATRPPIKSAPSPEALPNHVLQPARPRMMAAGAVSQHIGIGSALPSGSKGGATRRSAESFPSFPPSSSNVALAPRTKEAIANFDRDEMKMDFKAKMQARVLAAATVAATSQSCAHSRPRRVLPDLTRVASTTQIAGIVARPLPPTENGRPATRPFSLDPPPYTDEDIPEPEPYNKAYPHPLTAYASPGVNPATVKRSGYDRLLAKMVSEDIESALGYILYEAGFDCLANSVYLFLFEKGQGNGIPEKMWSQLESNNNAKLPVGLAGVSPFACPPRFSQNLTPAFTLTTERIISPGNIHCDPDFSATHAAMMQHGYGQLGNPSLEGFPSHSPSPTHRGPEQWNEVHLHQPSSGQNQIRQTPLPQVLIPTAQSLRANGASIGKGFVASKSSTPSPFYKTELCVTWERSRLCKYGGQCQYAHGPEELRLSRNVNHDRLPHAPAVSPSGYSHPQRQLGFTSSVDSGMIFADPEVLIPDSVPMARSISEPVSHRTRPRKLSVPLPQLPVVPEVEDNVTSTLQYRQTEPQVPAPIGAERFFTTTGPVPVPSIRPSPSSSANPTAPSSLLCTPYLGWVPELPEEEVEGDMPAYSFTPTESTFSGHRLSESLSTSSSSRFSMLSTTSYRDSCSKESLLFSPVDGEITIGDEVLMPAPTWDGSIRGGESTTSLDFSAGKSIWR
ncbi:hypothetical protein IAR55_007109 [Kwoniella newhampshirensis]|uniref:C3H1-type domain-containing protein n=1 Tax=Kwoniella newhampshirensis TaxID=1651941 RepID=A0AAW0YD43_9TREE